MCVSQDILVGANTRAEPLQPPHSTRAAPRETPLTQAVRSWHDALPSTELLGLRRALIGMKVPLSVGTACSGTDIAVLVLHEFARYWREVLGVTVPIRHLFACECNPEVQKFLQEQWPDCEALVPDMVSLVDDFVPTLGESGSRMVQLDAPDVFIAGFVCKARSRLNVNASSARGCVQHGTHSTGASFSMVSAYVSKRRPGLVILENVPDLDAPTDSGISDAQYVQDCLTSVGYVCTRFVLEARNYGSFPRRERIFWVAVAHPKPSTLAHDHMDCCMQRLLAAMATGKQATTLEDYLIDGEAQQVRKRRRKDTEGRDMKYKAEHMSLFDAIGQEWPAPLGKWNAALDHMEQRAYEVVVFADAAFPVQGAEADWEFLDSNAGLSRLVGPAGAQRPWSKAIPTLTGAARIVARRCRGGTVEVRQLDGIELLQLIGFSLADLNTSNITHDCATSMAGNAFSAFAIGPVMLAAFAVAPGIKALLGASDADDVNVGESDEDGSVCEDIGP